MKEDNLIDYVSDKFYKVVYANWQDGKEFNIKVAKGHIIENDDTHVVVQFPNGSKLSVLRSNIHLIREVEPQ